MDYKNKYDSLVTERRLWDKVWDPVGKLVFPNAGSFISTNVEAEQLNYNYDNSGNRAANRFTTMLFSQLTPRSTQWHGLKGPDGSDRKTDDITQSLFKYRYLPQHGFSQSILQCMMNTVVFGNGFLFLDEDKVNGGVNYINIPLNDMYIDLDLSRQLTTVFRKMLLTKEEANELFGDKVPSEVKKEKEEGSKFLFIHCVYKFAESEDKNSFKKGFRYKSVYLYGGRNYSGMDAGSSLKEIDKSDYYEMPYIYCQLQIGRSVV